MPQSNISDAILKQRKMLTSLLGKTMRMLSKDCVEILSDRSTMEALLTGALPAIPYCKHLYVLNARGHQLTDNINRDGPDPDQFGRDRSERPYLQGIVGSTDFKLSEAYISRNKKRPMLTAIQIIVNEANEHIGYLGADYDLRELPVTKGLYQESQEWRQIKGDPAIRGGLFQQQRAHSLMDDKLDVVMPVMAELMTAHGVFHGNIHFASSLATIWLMEDPYAYRILTIDELIDPNICLAYPHRPYTSRATVPTTEISRVFEMFRELRFADDTIYLRAGSLNVCNGMVSLNFSCDGSHYLRYEEFLSMGLELWFGAAGS